MQGLLYRDRKVRHVTTRHKVTIDNVVVTVERLLQTTICASAVFFKIGPVVLN
jgi:hypothetical protein